MNTEHNLITSLIRASFIGRMDLCFHESRTDTPSPYIVSVNTTPPGSFQSSLGSACYKVTFRWPCRNERCTGGMDTSLDVTVTFTHDNDGHILVIAMNGPEGFDEGGDDWLDLADQDDLISFMDHTCEYLIHAWNYHWCEIDDICNQPHE